MPGRSVVVVNASGEVSGAELVLLRLVERATADGRDVVVASPPGPLVARLGPGVRHVELPAAGRRGATGRLARVAATARWLRTWPSAASRLAAEVRRPATDTLVNSALALPVIRLARPRGETTWLVHDVLDTAATLRFARRSLGRGTRWRVVAVSAAAAAPLRRAGYTVAVRPNGVEWPVRAKPSTLRSPAVVGTVGLLTRWKGVHVLLDAAALVPGVRVELAGGHFEHDAGYVDELRARAAAPDLAGRVEFLGPVADPLVPMRRWDVFVSASTSPEAGPLTVVEAMSVGLPVVATAHGGPVEYLAHGRGELVPPQDPGALAGGITRLLADPERRRDLAARGREYVAAEHDRRRTLPAQYAAVMPA